MIFVKVFFGAILATLGVVVAMFGLIIGVMLMAAWLDRPRSQH